MHTITQLAPDDIPAAAEVIRQAFATVAEAFDLTEENCPTNGAFLRDAALAEEQERGTVLYGLSDEDGLSGCMALKRKDEATFSLEKLAVAPWSRNRGYGGALVAHAVEEVRRSGGGTICIGAMYENRKLVRWYERQGFSILREPGSSRTSRSWCVSWRRACEGGASWTGRSTGGMRR